MPSSDKKVTPEEWKKTLKKMKELEAKDPRKNKPDYGKLTVDALNKSQKE